jgi:uncharacterized protein YgiM (DUF1202 family)
MRMPVKAIGFGLLLSVILFQTATGTSTADAQTTTESPIVREALKYVGGHGGQCYVFVQKAVYAATGKWIGRAYRQGYFDAGAVEVNPDNAQAGDILQISNPSAQSSYFAGMHTAIVIENLGNRTYRVIDSNFGWDERVQVHTWTPKPAANLRLYAYRIGGANVVAPIPPAPVLNADDRAVVKTDGSCLNLRSGAGLTKPVINCLADGIEVTVLEKGVVVDGYTWTRVSTPAGEGWVASQYLSPVAVAVTPPPLEVSYQQAFSVDTEGFCLNLRAAAGLKQAIIRCLADGTAVSAVSAETKEVDGYTWRQVTTPAGTGWVADEYLRPR